jgi:hypothetical protein
MTEELILEWLNVVWKRQQGALLCKCAMLVFDSFRGHMTERVKAKVNEDSDLVVISGGMTGFYNLWMLLLIDHSRSLSGSFITSGWQPQSMN